MHAFYANTSSAVLDLLLPPYDEGRGRDCHYFELPATDWRLPIDVRACSSGRAQLRLTAAPSDLVIRAGTYCGPPVKQDQGTGAVTSSAHSLSGAEL